MSECCTNIIHCIDNEHLECFKKLWKANYEFDEYNEIINEHLDDLPLDILSYIGNKIVLIESTKIKKCARKNIVKNEENIQTFNSKQIVEPKYTEKYNFSNWFNDDNIVSCIENDDFDRLQILLSFKKYGDDNEIGGPYLFCSLAVEKNNIRMLEYLHKKEYPLGDWLAPIAVSNGSVKCLEFLHKNNVPFGIRTYEKAKNTACKSYLKNLGIHKLKETECDESYDSYIEMKSPSFNPYARWL